MADLSFDLEYDGPALQAHEMDVRDLAPALLSTADLFQELNRTIYPVAPPLSINVRATAEGSFLVQLKLIYDSTIQTLSGDEITAVANLGGLLAITGGLVGFFRQRSRSNVVDESVRADDPGQARITFEDGTVLEVPEAVLRVRDNVSVQRNLAEIVRPVGTPGVEVMRIRREEITIAEVVKADAPAFDVRSVPAQREILHSGERDTFLTIHTAGFQTNRWRFWDGQSLVWAAIRDEAFIDDLDSGARRVGKWDVLHCRIREEQWRDATGFHREVEVTEVMEVRPYEPAMQPPLLPDDDRDTPTP